MTNAHGIRAVALTPSELALTLRAVRVYRTAQRRTKADVVAMLEHAIDERERAWLGMSEAFDTLAEREVAR